MKIVVIAEGRTEKVFMPILKSFIDQRVPEGRRPRLSVSKYDGKIPTGDKLRKRVHALLNDGARSADYVIALTDVYTGDVPPVFTNAQEAKQMMTDWVGNEHRFFAHAAQHDFEAWLIPYWTRIQELADHNKSRPGVNPEGINHDSPPADRIKEIYRLGTQSSYVKTRDATKILENQDLMVSINECAEFKAFVNTILSLSGGTLIP